MKLVLFFVLNFCFFQMSNSQLDNSNVIGGRGRVIGIISSDKFAKKNKKPKMLEFGNDNGFKIANKELEEKRARKRKEEEFNNKGIFTPKIQAKQVYKKNIEGKFKNFPMIDMDLGSFHTKSKNIYINSYDFGVFDGDRVQITVKGNRIHNNYLLTSQLKTIKIPLVIGFNKIEVTAINEGKLSPNTGYFAFFDDNKYVIKEGQWMLATGAKVIVMVIRDDN